MEYPLTNNRSLEALGCQIVLILVLMEYPLTRRISGNIVEEIVLILVLMEYPLTKLSFSLASTISS